MLVCHLAHRKLSYISNDPMQDFWERDTAILHPYSTENTPKWSSPNAIDVEIDGYLMRLPSIGNMDEVGDIKRIDAYLSRTMRVAEFYGYSTTRSYAVGMMTTDAHIIHESNRSETVDIPDMHVPEPNDDGMFMLDGPEEALVNETDSSYHDYRCHQRKDMEGYLRMIDDLLSSIEDQAMGSQQEYADISVSMRRSSFQVSLMLMFPRAEGKHAQLLIMLGMRKWKREIVCMSVSPCSHEDDAHIVPDNFMVIKCSCSLFEAKEECEHARMIYECERMMLKIRSILNRNVSMATFRDDIREWVALRAPPCDEDDFTAWFVYKPGFVGVIGEAYASVTLDCRKRRIKNGLKARLQCRICPGSTMNVGMCAHVEYVHAILMAETGATTEDDANAIGMYADGEMAVLSDADEEDVQVENSNPAPTYQSFMHRNVFPCDSDGIILKRTMNAVFKKKSEWQEGIDDAFFIGMDIVFQCRSCKKFWMTAPRSTRTSSSTRVVNLHTLSHGCIRIRVQDNICKCGTVARYDGLTDGIFCATIHHAFTRELLDAWIFDVCGLGMSFRESFMSWKRKACSISAQLNTIDKPTCVLRRMGNVAFTSFLRLLRFSDVSILKSIFSCKSCTGTNEANLRHWSAVVMDGTATGILGKLPKFQRPTVVMAPIKNASSKQYIMPTAPHRDFLDHLLMVGKKNEGKNEFPLDFPPKMNAETRASCIGAFFSELPLSPSNQQAYIARLFLSTCLTKHEEKLIHNFQDLDIRRAWIEFGRCFMTGSIPGGVLRMSRSVHEARKLSDALVKFSSCAHDNDGFVCHNCANELYKRARLTRDWVPILARMGKAIASVSIYRSIDGAKLKTLATTVAIIVMEAEKVHDKYMWSFQSSMNPAISSYADVHKDGLGLHMPAEEDWMDEACVTGQFFPADPLVRPCIDFGNAKKAENTKSCRKHYRKSDSHSPGIFTAQCVCRYPKLVGVSVMDECEGVSTALSVLLSRFRILPRVCYYDNGCNLLKSVILRVPWLNDRCLIASDRFHYRTHKCNSVTDPDSYLMCKEHQTSGAESINQQWKFSKAHVRYLAPNNLMPYLAIRSIFINIGALIRESSNATDLDDVHYRNYFANAWVCKCTLCRCMNIIIPNEDA